MTSVLTLAQFVARILACVAGAWTCFIFAPSSFQCPLVSKAIWLGGRRGDVGEGGQLFLKGLDKLGGWFDTLLLNSLKMASPTSKVKNDQPLRSLIIPNKELPSWLN